MATTTKEPQAIAADEEFNLLEWAQANSRALGIGALVVAAAGLGVFLYMQSAATKSANAEAAFTNAVRSYATGNLDQASADLQRLIVRYDGTSAAAEGTISLAQIQYQRGAYQVGIDALKKAAENHSSGPFAAPILKMLAAGYSDSNNPALAAETYKRAADASLFEAEAAQFRSAAARAYAAAGNKAAAIAIWEELAKSSDRTIANDAKLRLGEAQTQAAGKG